MPGFFAGNVWFKSYDDLKLSFRVKPLPTLAGPVADLVVTIKGIFVCEPRI